MGDHLQGAIQNSHETLDIPIYSRHLAHLQWWLQKPGGHSWPAM